MRLIIKYICFFALPLLITGCYDDYSHGSFENWTPSSFYIKVYINEKGLEFSNDAGTRRFDVYTNGKIYITKEGQSNWFSISIVEEPNFMSITVSVDENKIDEDRYGKIIIKIEEDSSLERTVTILQKGTRSGYVGSHEYVNLGLPSGIKWATCNVGASKPEEFGDYFAFGETSIKQSYSYDNSLVCEKSYNTCVSEGILDSTGNLNKNYDAASKNWGSTWRTPTEIELSELINNCTWLWTELNGVKGYNVIGKDGKYIFFPAAGSFYYSNNYVAGENGNYMISTYLNLTEVRFLWFGSGFHRLDRHYVYNGVTVRPVSL